MLPVEIWYLIIDYVDEYSWFDAQNLREVLCLVPTSVFQQQEPGDPWVVTNSVRNVMEQ